MNTETSSHPILPLQAGCTRDHDPTSFNARLRNKRHRVSVRKLALRKATTRPKTRSAHGEPAAKQVLLIDMSPAR